MTALFFITMSFRWFMPLNKMEEGMQVGFSLCNQVGY